MTEERAYGEVFNVGASEEISILELAERVIDLTGSDSEISLIPYDEAYEEGFEDMHRRVPDITKIQELIGWHPTRTLKDVIEDVVACQRGRPSPPATMVASGTTVSSSPQASTDRTSSCLPRRVTVLPGEVARLLRAVCPEQPAAGNGWFVV